MASRNEGPVGNGSDVSLCSSAECVSFLVDLHADFNLVPQLAYIVVILNYAILLVCRYKTSS